jgi:excisionase family DNA binding protein
VTSPWLCTIEAASYTKLSVATINRARRSGALKAYCVSGKRLWRFRVEDLDTWLMAEAR